MKKKVILRCLIGAPIGLSISFIITLIISVIINKGEYYPVVPQLTALCGKDMENWSLLKQTVLHLLIISVSSLPIAYCMYWIPHTFRGIVLYVSIFFFIYFFIWLAGYFAMKKKIREINEKVKADFVNM